MPGAKKFEDVPIPGIDVAPSPKEKREVRRRRKCDTCVAEWKAGDRTYAQCKVVLLDGFGRELSECEVHRFKRLYGGPPPCG